MPTAQPHTTFANGLNPFLFGVVPPAAQPEKAHTMPSKLPGRPAKPAAKTRLTDEDYSTPYQPPMPTAKASSAVATKPPSAPRANVQLPALDAIQIDNDVPLPAVQYRPDAKARKNILAALLGKLQPKQSAALPITAYATLNKLLSATHKTGPARYAVRRDRTAQTMRVWRLE